MIYDSVPLSWFTSNWGPVGGEGWSDTEYYGRQIIRGITVTQPYATFIDTKDRVPRDIDIEEPFLVKLGGPFENVGGDDTAVGGAYKKAGT